MQDSTPPPHAASEKPVPDITASPASDPAGAVSASQPLKPLLTLTGWKEWPAQLRVLWRRACNLVQTNFDLGVQMAASGHMVDAVFRFRVVTWLAPAHADGWYALGCCYLATGKPDKARECLSRALKERPQFAEAKRLLEYVAASPAPDDAAMALTQGLLPYAALLAPRGRAPSA